VPAIRLDQRIALHDLERTESAGAASIAGENARRDAEETEAVDDQAAGTARPSRYQYPPR
jgi:hypothetical protein